MKIKDYLSLEIEGFVIESFEQILKEKTIGNLMRNQEEKRRFIRGDCRLNEESDGKEKATCYVEFWITLDYTLRLIFRLTKRFKKGSRLWLFFAPPPPKKKYWNLLELFSKLK